MQKTKLVIFNKGEGDDQAFNLMNVRVNFPNLFKRTEPTEKSPKGIGKGATAMLDKDEDAAIIKKIQSEIIDVLKRKNKGKKVPSDKRCLKDGDESGRDEYENQFTLRTGKGDTQKLLVYAAGSKDKISEEENQIYSGCYVNMKFQLYFGTKGGNGVWGDLVAIQFANDGPPLDAGSMSEEEATEGFDEGGEDDEGFGEDDEEQEDEDDGW